MKDTVRFAVPLPDLVPELGGGVNLIDDLVIAVSGKFRRVREDLINCCACSLPFVFRILTRAINKWWWFLREVVGNGRARKGT